MSTQLRAVEAQQLDTIDQQLRREAEQACRLAIEHRKPGALHALLAMFVMRPDLPLPYGRVFAMLRMALAQLTPVGQEDLADLLYAMGHGDEELYMASAAELLFLDDLDIADFVDEIVTRNSHPEDRGERRRELVAELTQRWMLDRSEPSGPF